MSLCIDMRWDDVEGKKVNRTIKGAKGMSLNSGQTNLEWLACGNMRLAKSLARRLNHEAPISLVGLASQHYYSSANKIKTFKPFVCYPASLLDCLSLKLLMAPTNDKVDLPNHDTHSGDLFGSSSRATKKPGQTYPTVQRTANTPSASSREPVKDPDSDAEEAREASLQRELAGIRSINRVIEGVVDSLERAKGNMDVCLRHCLICWFP